MGVLFVSVWNALISLGTFASAAFTAWMAGTTKQMVTETKNSLKISRDALAIERETFNKMNDSLIPVLVPSISLGFSEVTGFCYSITIDNHGPGVAFVQEINAI